jgi:type II secretory pathway component PulK
MSNRGVILIFVLIVISFAVGIVLMINKNSTEKYEKTMNIYFENQASLYAFTAVKAVSKALEDDDNSYDSADDDWYSIPPLPIKDGFVSVKVIPLNKKIDINKIIYSDAKHKNEAKKIRQRYLNAIKTVFENIYESDNTSAGLNAPSLGVLIDWIDEDSKINEDGGDEQGLFYENNDKTYTVKNRLLESLYELNYIEGFNLLYSRGKNYLTVLSKENKININFASKQVIEAFLPEVADYAEDIISYRQDSPFKDISQIRNVGIDDETYLKILKYISVKSSLFKLKILVIVNSVSFNYEAVVQRDNGKTKILKYIEEANEDYF